MIAALWGRSHRSGGDRHEDVADPHDPNRPPRSTRGARHLPGEPPPGSCRRDDPRVIHALNPVHRAHPSALRRARSLRELFRFIHGAMSCGGGLPRFLFSYLDSFDRTEPDTIGSFIS